MSREFAGKVVVISGGSRGIGYGIAAAFAARGAQTVLAALSIENLKAGADAIASGTALRPEVCAADLRTEEGCKAVFDLVSEKFGRCDVLVNSAGATRGGEFIELSEEAWHDGFALKLFGCVSLCRLFWPMLKAARGHIINIAVRPPNATYLIGGAVNAAMHSFTKGLSVLGARDGVNVNEILPGPTEASHAPQDLQQRAVASGKSIEEERQAYIAREGVTRLGRPEDVAELAIFLSSEGARHIQGISHSEDIIFW